MCRKKYQPNRYLSIETNKIETWFNSIPFIYSFYFILMWRIDKEQKERNKKEIFFIFHSRLSISFIFLHRTVCHCHWVNSVVLKKKKHAEIATTTNDKKIKIMKRTKKSFKNIFSLSRLLDWFFSRIVSFM